MNSPITSVDAYSVTVTPIEILFGTTLLGTATGFFYAVDGQAFLVTNWHVATGVNPETGTHISATAAEPDRLRYWHVGSHLADACALEVMLCDAAGDPTWFAHPERAGAIDVAAIPIELPPGRHVRPINALDLDDELTVEVGMETFVLGYPLDRRPTGTLPIWKRASIATEPSLQPNNLPTFLIDTATRSSMSGAPVIVRSRAHNGNGHSNGHNGSSAPITRLLGVYSGRLGASDVEAQLGIVWRADALEETIAGRCRARRPFIS